MTLTTDIKSRKSSLAIPMTKGSPFLEPFNKAILKLKESGALHKLIVQYSLDHKESIACEPDKVSAKIHSCISNRKLTQYHYPLIDYPTNPLSKI